MNNENTGCYSEWRPLEEILFESPGGLVDGSYFGCCSCQAQLIWPLFGKPGEPASSPPVIISTEWLRRKELQQQRATHNCSEPSNKTQLLFIQ